MGVNTSRSQRRELQKENLRWPIQLLRVPENEWPPGVNIMAKKPAQLWRSRFFLVQVFAENSGIERLSVIRTNHNGENWEEGISWDELQKIKHECGCGGRDAVEVYPRDSDIVNVANMRHLWVLPEPLPFAWRNRSG